MAPLIENRLTHFATHMETPVSLPFGGGEVVIFTRAAPDKLGANEDALAVLHLGPMAGVLAVADGCGGESNGQEAARLVCKLSKIVEIAKDAQINVRIQSDQPAYPH